MSDQVDGHRIPEYWGQIDDELLTCVDLDEAVEMFIDQQHGHPVPTTVTMYGYAPRVLTENSVKLAVNRALESVLESLDDAYGSSEEYSEPTPAMEAAAEAFAQVIAKEYHVWACEKVTDAHLIDCKAWVAEHAPEWMDGIEWEDS